MSVRFWLKSRFIFCCITAKYQDIINTQVTQVYQCIFGFIYMMGLLFSSNYPGAPAPLWQYFGASLDHSVLALCFLTFLFGEPELRLSVKHLRYDPR